MFLVFSLHATQMKFVRIVDGDTAVFQESNLTKIKCRMAYIDTPESAINDKAKRNAADCNATPSDIVSLGTLSKNYAHNYFLAHPVVDVTVNSIDKYNRSVCVVQDYNLVVVRDGYATVYKSFTPKDKKLIYLPLQDDAIAHGFGLWKVNPDLMQCLGK
jgi:endonuclease YncB( thermonuclease family)